MGGLGARIAFLCALAASIASPGCTNHAPVALTGKTMGTSYSIRLPALPQRSIQHQLQTEIDRRLETVNNQMSTWRPESEISRFNRYEETDWFEVSPEFAVVVQEAKRISELSDGAFDVTVAPLVELWKFNSKERLETLPDESEIAAAKKRVGISMIEVRDDPPALRKSRADVTIDLSAIAKGYGVDVVADYLESVGATDYLIEIGGETRVKGTKANGEKWRVGVEKPVENERTVYRVLELSDAAVATSGDYRNFTRIDGRRFTHTIDPRTGRPVAHGLASVTVVHESCMTADALATALTVLGPEDGYDAAVRQNLPVFFLIRDDDGDGIRSLETPALARISHRP